MKTALLVFYTGKFVADVITAVVYCYKIVCQSRTCVNMHKKHANLVDETPINMLF